MDLHELITQCQAYVADAVGFELVDDFSSAYDCIDRLYELLIEKFGPMERTPQ